MVDIRSYKNPDFSDLIGLLKDAEIYHKPVDNEEIFKKKISIDPESIIVAEIDGKIMGCVFIAYDPCQSFIYHLGVGVNHRKEGIGTKLMEKAENILKKRGMLKPKLYVEEGNEEVIEFYNKQGWHISCNAYCL